jgi:hypothetical protein
VPDQHGSRGIGAACGSACSKAHRLDRLSAALFPRPNSLRSQCRGFFFAGGVMAKEPAILSVSRSVAAYWR